MSSIGSITSGSNYLAQISQSLFSQTDTDSDSSISKDELAALMKNNPKLAEDLTSYYNSSATGSTTSSANIDAIFKALDTDGDGAISASEMSAAVTNTKGGQIDGTPPPPPPSSDEVFAGADTDGNGSISESELKTLLTDNSQLATAFASLLSSSTTTDTTSTATDKTAAIFKALATDGDGTISASELSTAFSKLRDQMQAGGSTTTDQAGSSNSTTNSSASIESLLEKFLLKNGYTQDGTSASASLPSLFNTTA